MEFKKNTTKHHMVEQLLWGFWSHHVVGIQTAHFYNALILFTAESSPGESKKDASSEWDCCLFGVKMKKVVI